MVKHPIIDLGSGRDLRVVRSTPMSGFAPGSALDVQTAEGFLSPSASLWPSPTVSHPL